MQFQLLRSWSASNRLQLTAKLSRNLRAACLAGIKCRCQVPAQIRTRFDQAVLGEKWTPDFQPWVTAEMVWIQDSFELAGQLHEVFKPYNIPYYAGGGIASGTHGEPRATRDLDLVIQIQLEAISELVTVLETEGFYILPGAVEDITAGRSRTLNITNMSSSANADLFVMDDSEFAHSQMARREQITVEGNQFWICSPEDVILSKLLRRQRSQSEKQWRDVLGVLKVQGEHLDCTYLRQWAERLAIASDLEQVLREAGL